MKGVSTMSWLKGDRAADNPVMCAAYAKKHNLLNLPGWRRFRNIARSQKSLTSAINQTKSDRSEGLPHTNLVI